jgi:peptidoglycan/xylan/chitin deacetylase (PgdA/CDA1 family)
MTPSQFMTRLQGWYIRRTATFFFRRLAPVSTPVPLISFTFDDFPRSALLTGGAILRCHGHTGTYYASLGLMGRQAASGPIFLQEDLKELLAQGHELGCHTFGHCDSWKTNPSVFENSIVENQRALGVLFPGTVFQTMSYPYNPPRAHTKRRTGRHFHACRGGGQIFNAGTMDLNYLSAYFLEKSRNNPAAVKEMIDRNRQARGWLIFATHDVCDQPTPFGCTPEFFDEIVQYSLASGARVLTVAGALESLYALSS